MCTIQDGRCPDRIRKERWTNPDTSRIVAHPYEASPHSGAGNCWCGRAEVHRLHIRNDTGERDR
ncbi:MAG TPA: hypothetical protein VIP77_04920 [Jiangellaceae bacterium]